MEQTDMQSGPQRLMATIDTLMRDGWIEDFATWEAPDGDWERTHTSVPGAYIHIVQRGSLLVEVFDDGHAPKAESGDVILLPRGSGHRLKTVGGHDWKQGNGGASSVEVCTITYRTPRATDLIELLPSCMLLRRDFSRPMERVFDLVRLLLEGFREPGWYFPSIAARLTESVLLAGVFRDLKAHLPEVTMDQGSLDVRIARAISSMGSDHSRAWTVESLADHCGMSRSAFAAGFKRHVGQTPKAYLAGLRISEAQRLLVNTRLTLAAIARQIGYSNLVSFSHAFKNMTGVSPGEYRRNPSTREQAVQFSPANPLRPEGPRRTIQTSAHEVA